MNVAILDVRKGENRKAENSITVAYRNLLILKRELNADLFINASEINFNKRYDVIICGFGSIATEKDKSTEFLKLNKDARLYWLVGDYEQTTFAPLFYCGRKYDVIKNYPHHMKNKHVDKQHFININTLLMRSPNKLTDKKYDLIYWGRWRDGRVDYFKRYFKDRKCYLSTSSKNFKKFISHKMNPVFIKPFRWDEGQESLNLFRYSLYIEDRFSNINYCCLANRFYEAVFCNVVQFFDVSCMQTILKSGLDLDPIFVINGLEDYNKIIAKYTFKELLDKQRGFVDFALQEKQEAIKQIKDLILN